MNPPSIMRYVSYHSGFVGAGDRKSAQIAGSKTLLETYLCYSLLTIEVAPRNEAARVNLEARVSAQERLGLARRIKGRLARVIPAQLRVAAALHVPARRSRRNERKRRRNERRQEGRTARSDLLSTRKEDDFAGSCYLSPGSATPLARGRLLKVCMLGVQVL